MQKLVPRSLQGVILGLTTLAFATAACRAQQPGDGRQQFANLGKCKLVSGKQIDNCRLGYRTWGKLNAAHSNAVLFPTWFSGVSANLSDVVGASALVDPSRYFVIVVDALGDGVSSSPSNSATQHGPDFPALTIQDMVNTEHRLATETLGLKHLHAVMGISMGGQQTFEWMVDYPDFMDEVIPMVGSPRPSTRDLLVYHAVEDALKADPAWRKGLYTKAPPAGEAELILQMNLTTPANFARTHSRVQFDADYAHYQANGILPTDANDWLAQVDAIIHLDVAHGGSLAGAAKSVKARVLIVSSAQDHLVNPQPALDFAKLIGAKTLVLEGDCGHLATSCEAATMYPVVRAFLDKN
jgi:homoserine O-acetyltransferase/O-succinyltransferase